MNEDALLKALANSHRRGFLEWLREPRKHFPPPLEEHAGLPGACASYIFEKSDLSQPTVTQYLQMLEGAGLLCRHRHGRWTFYSRDEAAIAEAAERLVRILKGADDGKNTRAPREQ